MQATTQPRRPDPVAEARDPGVLVDVVVLSADLVLFDAIKGAIGERNPVWRARSAEESVDLLLTGKCGVLLLDMAAVSTRPASLVEQIGEQFPDVVVVVAGRREDEALLAQLISEGLVYRFMHKPLTAKRAGMFLHAAIRCHVERREARARTPLLPLSTVLPKRVDSHKWVFVAAGVAAFAAVLGLLAGQGERRMPAAQDARLEPARPAAVEAPPQADPVLSRARAAFEAGRFESPAGRNALDLYAAVLLAEPTQAEALRGLDRTVFRVVADARKAADAGDRDEAERLLARLLAVAPDHAGTERLARLLDPPLPPLPPLPAELLAGQHGADGAAETGPRAPTSSMPPAMQPSREAGRPATRAAGSGAVRPDPLAPRISNSADLAARASFAAQRRAGVLSPGRPVPSLPIAGYVSGSRPETAPATASAATAAHVPAHESGSVGAFALPVDEMDRVYATDPIYPAAALQSGTEGWVELMFTITETGTVRDVEVVAAEPRGVFESAATQAVGHWRYRPRLANGQPVPRRSYVTLRFNVDG
jgi:TonB family protein